MPARKPQVPDAEPTPALVPLTATKSRAAGLAAPVGSGLGFALAMLLNATLNLGWSPEMEVAAAAILTAIGGGASAALAAYWASNKPKG